MIVIKIVSSIVVNVANDEISARLLPVKPRNKEKQTNEKSGSILDNLIFIQQKKSPRCFLSKEKKK